jgi:SAM-dependent methyltransferase
VEWEVVNDLQSSYDRVADEYVRRIYDELRHKPLDRELLDRFAGRVGGPVADLGCGPGHVARYLHERGVGVRGIDLSPLMVERATSLNAGIEFRQADMKALPDADGTWAGLVAFYSIIHVPRAEVVETLREWRRVLRPGGLLLLTFHLGDDVVHLDELWDQPVSMDFSFFRSQEMAEYLRLAGFEVEEIIEREPYPDVEYPSRRAYIFARRPDRSQIA